MALEAQEVAVRVAMLGGSQFQKDAEKNAASIEGIGAAGKTASKELNASFGESALTGITAFSTKLKSAGSKLTSIGRSMMPASIASAAGLAYAGKQYMDFNQKMTLLVTQAHLAPKALAGVTTGVMNLSKQFAQTPIALADAMYPIESIGLRGKKALDALKASAIGTDVGLDSLANTSDAVTTILASGIKGAGGPLQAMALMDSAIGSGKMHLADLTASFKSAIVPMASTFGVTFPQILAAASAMTRMGTPAAQVMSRMRLTMTSMVAPTQAGSAALSDLSLGPAQLAQTLQKKGLIAAVQQLATAAKRMNDPIRSNADIAAIFGRSRGLGNILELMKSLPQAEGIYKTVLGTTPATLMKHLQETQQTPAYKLAQIKANFDATMVQLGKVVDTKILPILETLGTYLGKVGIWFGKMPKPLQTIVIGFLALVAVLGPILMIVGGFLTAIGTIAGAFTGGAALVGGAIRLLIGPQALEGLRVGIGETASSFALLVPALAAALGVYEMWHNKTIRKAVEGAGKSSVDFLGTGAAQWLKTLGITSKPMDYMDTVSYLHSKAYTSLNAVDRSDIAGLMQPGSWAQLHQPQVASDLKGSGINIDKIPGIASAIKVAIKEGMASANVSVLIPNGKVLAQTVNETNRKQQNRR